MKIHFLLFLLLLFGCSNRESNTMNAIDRTITGVREDAISRLKSLNKKREDWDLKVQEIKTYEQTDFHKAILFADSLIKNDPSLNEIQLNDLQGLVGEIYYRQDSFDSAIERFNIVSSRMESPMNLVNKSKCYLKKENLSKSLEILKELSSKYPHFEYLIGNYYEILNDKKKAQEIYTDLLKSKDEGVRGYSSVRLGQLKEKNAPLLKEFQTFLDD